MRTYLDCLPCFMNQIVRVGSLLELSEADCLAMLREFAGRFDEIKLEDPPPKTAITLYNMISRYSGRNDPFKEIKRESTEKALALYPELKKRVKLASAPLSLAAKFAVAGNVIDFGVASQFDLAAEIDRVVDDGAFGHWHEESFFKALEKAEWLLYLGDNTGETVMDRLFIETITKETGTPVSYVVRENPIINDAILEDALAAGLDGCAEIISSGCSAPGTVLDLCHPEFLKLFYDAPLIVSKGQGNYETLSGVDAPIFFFLKAKCSVVADHLGAQMGDLVLTKENE
ncbi:MAG: ARMT1-like domain-containing protein [Pseudomonadota bacterium]|nr:ARMT1-like domain-containing protein [Pseudomonadota bacterium]